MSDVSDVKEFDEFGLRLKEYINLVYKSMSDFSKDCKIPQSTLTSIFKRGVMNANMSNISSICNTLNLDMDELANGNIIPKRSEEALTPKQKALIRNYEKSVELQPAIDKLLDLEKFAN